MVNLRAIGRASRKQLIINTLTRRGCAIHIHPHKSKKLYINNLSAARNISKKKLYSKKPKYAEYFLVK